MGLFSRKQPAAPETESAGPRMETVSIADTAIQDFLGYGSAKGPNGALRSSAVYACVRLIASNIAPLPLRVTVADIDVPHPLPRLLNKRPNPRWNPVQLRERIIVDVTLRGNAYVWVAYSASQQVEALYYISPDRVTPVALPNGRVAYRIGADVRAGFPEAMTVDQDDMLHFTGLVKDGLKGRGVLQTGAARATDLESSMTDHIISHYRNGALQQHALIFKRGLDEKQAKSIKRKWAEKYARGADAQNEPILLEASEVDLMQLSATARDMQTLELRDWSVSDIGRAFGVPGVLLNQEHKTSSWGTGVSAMKEAFHTFVVSEWINRIAAEINFKLFAFEEATAHFDLDEALRGDRKFRYETNAIGLGGRPFLTVNEVRELEGYPRTENPQDDEIPVEVQQNATVD